MKQKLFFSYPCCWTAARQTVVTKSFTPNFRTMTDGCICVLWLHSCLWYFNEWMSSAPLVEMLYFPTRIIPQRQLSNNNTLSDSCLATFSFRPLIGMCIVLTNTSPGCKILKYSLTLWLFIAYCHHSVLRIQGKTLLAFRAKRKWKE